ncbi:MAPEG family protein [Parvibaculum sp.]|jgi:glutathione S-transferase|uniref:MAPEG family protein n=1 Tax=Parvibaculum sp. TaxID=2024848 RepID=UPI000C59C316|nr:MAPEG family protein [Parvibaculum sp.]MAM94386.1 MAPEG domain-containing protein [Parvibaculum sp.]|tara:strand:- start:6978 stop:7388 length:411 start_codon:yes stop_codon:yes gene_type:complete
MTPFAYPLTGLVTLIALAVYFWMAFKVGKARGSFGIPAPRMDGPDDFLRVLRVQGNTTEALILFLPALWLFALTIGDIWAAAVGLIFPIGRVVYARGYYAEALKRSTGFTIGLLSIVVLWLGAAIALAMQAITAYI